MTGPGNGQASSHADDRRRVLREAAARLFEARGYHGTSVEEVAAAAGLNKGTLYYYFKAKSEILAAIYADTVDALHEAMDAIPPTSSAADALAQLIRVQVRQVALHPEQIVVYFQEGGRLHHWLPAKQCREIRDRERSYRSFVESLVQRGIDEGTFAPADAGIVTNAIIGMSAWTYQWFTTSGHGWFEPSEPRTVDAIADVFVRVALDGLAR